MTNSLMSTIVKDAIISPCDQYRYALHRRWGAGGAVVFVMLNPSTADAENDDPTIRRCIGFAREWGFNAIQVVNLFAFRATNPQAMRAAVDPVGSDNDQHLITAFSSAEDNRTPIVAAWGTHGSYCDRAAAVIALRRATPMTCLGMTKDGHPRHPLYRPGDQPLVEFRP